MTTKRVAKTSALQQRLAECERGAQLIKGLFDAGNEIPDWLTDVVMDALTAAAGFKRVEFFGETDFDMDGLASLLLVTRHFDLRHGEDALAWHISEVLNNLGCPTPVYNALAEAVCVVGSGELTDSAQVIAAELRRYKAQEAVKEGGAR